SVVDTREKSARFSVSVRRLSSCLNGRALTRRGPLGRYGHASLRRARGAKALPHMRWFVEISSLGSNPSGATTLCVEAPPWQPALQKARALRGDEGALSGFSIELLDDGYRAIDPTTRIRYIVRRAPDDAVLSNGTAPSSEASAKAPAQDGSGTA